MVTSTKSIAIKGRQLHLHILILIGCDAVVKGQPLLNLRPPQESRSSRLFASKLPLEQIEGEC